MNKKVILAVVALVIILGGTGYALFGMDKKAEAPAGNNQATTSSKEVTEKEASTPVSSSTAMATIVFTNEGFTPNNLTVKKGTVITVKNESSKSVQFSSDDHPTHRLNTEMNLKTLAAGESASFVAETVGTHGFHDHIDDSKTGTLVVTE